MLGLILKGESVPRPICRECRRIGDKPMALKSTEFYLCKPCMKMVDEKLKRGQGVTLRAM